MVRQDRGIGTMLGYISYELQGTRLDGDVSFKNKNKKFFCLFCFVFVYADALFRLILFILFLICLVTEAARLGRFFSFIGGTLVFVPVLVTPTATVTLIIISRLTSDSLSSCRLQRIV